MALHGACDMERMLDDAGVENELLIPKNQPVCVCAGVRVCGCAGVRVLCMSVCLSVCLPACLSICVYVCMDGWMDGWIDGWT